MMDKRKLDGAVDESSVEQQIKKSSAIVQKWCPTPWRTGSYGRLSCRQVDESR